MNKKKNKKIYISLILSSLFFVVPFFPLLAASDDPYATPPSVFLEVPFGDTVLVVGLAGYIQVFYEFIIFAIAIGAVIMLMLGGFFWATASGNSSRVAKAKSYIFNAILGLSLALGSFLLLYTLNPDLVSIEKLNIPKVELAEDVSPICNFDPIPEDKNTVEIKIEGEWKDVTEEYLGKKPSTCGENFKIHGSKCFGTNCSGSGTVCLPTGGDGVGLEGKHFECTIPNADALEKACEELEDECQYINDISAENKIEAGWCYKENYQYANIDCQWCPKELYEAYSNVKQTILKKASTKFTADESVTIPTSVDDIKKYECTTNFDYTIEGNPIGTISLYIHQEMADAYSDQYYYIKYNACEIHWENENCN